jgi:ribose/xylose/arabinose/galactoside ABC-type transport system permease subunit
LVLCSRKVTTGAWYSGINVKRHNLALFALVGLMAGLAAVLLTVGSAAKVGFMQQEGEGSREEDKQRKLKRERPPHVSGINVKRHNLALFALVGLMAGLAAVLLTSRLGSTGLLPMA